MLLFCAFFMIFIFIGSLKVSDENSRIRIHYSEARIPGSGSVPKCHRSATLIKDQNHVLNDREVSFFHCFKCAGTGPPNSRHISTTTRRMRQTLTMASSGSTTRASRSTSMSSISIGIRLSLSKSSRSFLPQRVKKEAGHFFKVWNDVRSREYRKWKGSFYFGFSGFVA